MTSTMKTHMEIQAASARESVRLHERIRQLEHDREERDNPQSTNTGPVVAPSMIFGSEGDQVHLQEYTADMALSDVLDKVGREREKCRIQ